MKLQSGDSNYDKAEILSLREAAIELRDSALAAGMMDWSVTLSHIVAVLSLVAELVEE